MSCFERHFSERASGYIGIVLCMCLGCGNDPMPAPTGSAAVSSTTSSDRSPNTASAAAAGAQVSTGPAAPSLPAKTVNLLDHVVTSRDQVQGEFSLASGALVIPAVAGAQLELPVEPPGEYQLEIEVERTSGKDSLNIGLVVGGNQTMLVLEGWGRMKSGLNVVSGRTADDNPTTYSRPIFRPGAPTKILCIVSPQHVLVECDGRRIIDWQGNAADLSLAATAKMRSPRRLTIGGWQTQFRVTKLQLTSLTNDLVKMATGTVASTTPPSANPTIGAGWSLFDDSSLGFAVKLPQTPEASEIDGTRLFQAKTPQGLFQIAVVPAERTDNSSAAEFLDRWQAETFNEGERLIREGKVTKRGADAAKEFAYIDRDNDLVAGCCILTKDRLYQVLYIGPSDRLDHPETKFFLESFELHVK